MNKLGRLIAIFSIIVIILITLIGGGSIVAYLTFVTFPFIFWIGHHYDKSVEELKQLNTRYQSKEKDYREVLEKNTEYEQLFDSLEGAVFYRTLTTNTLYLSTGIEELFGLPFFEYKNQPEIWKEMVDTKDRLAVEEADRLLKKGQPSKIEFKIIHPVKGLRWVLRMATPIHNEAGHIEKIVGQMVDITVRKNLEFELKQMAYHDELTDLPNRKSLDRQIEKALARSKRHDHNFSIMFIDLDDFKVVNDTMGHDAGDTLLKEVVSRLNESIREEDLVARIGGDEFIVLFEETSKGEIEEIARRILEYVSKPYNINEKEANISLSIGISMFPDDGEDKDTLIEHADTAMYFSKYNGKNCYKLYTPDLEDMEFKKVGLLKRWKHTIKKTKLFN
ncbi:sensor domain-containing diguanylate cyclase [Bacillus sp. FJAT-45037]|uniref:sensor domain-containing diguanylate cyclase n=1 Tax=Bacillus sp. FJAT-45037 TaxID=2011007 RepID=UPI000C24D898|nr:sensor domain-containing diguanylate cyclase [Bacillus sp. FJAT-45037]